MKKGSQPEHFFGCVRKTTSFLETHGQVFKDISIYCISYIYIHLQIQDLPGLLHFNPQKWLFGAVGLLVVHIPRLVARVIS